MLASHLLCEDYLTASRRVVVMAVFFWRRRGEQVEEALVAPQHLFAVTALPP